MEWHIMNQHGLGSIFSNIGCHLDDCFFISTEADESLTDLLEHLKQDTQNYTGVQLYMATHESMKKVILPFIENLGEEDEESRSNLFALLIRCLAYVTQPVNPSVLQDKRYTISEAAKIQDFLLSVKLQLHKKGIIHIIINVIHQIVHQEGILNDYDIQTVNSCLLTIRNILYISSPDTILTYYLDILTLNAAFECGIQDVIMKITHSSQLRLMALSLVQILSLFYKHDLVSLCVASVEEESSKETSNKWQNVSGTSDGVTSGDVQQEESDEGCPVIEDTNHDMAPQQDTSLGEDENVMGAQRSTTAFGSSTEENSSMTDSPSANSIHSSDIIQPKMSFPSQQRALHLIQAVKSLHHFTRMYIRKGKGKLIECLRELSLDKDREGTETTETYFNWVFSFFISYSLTYLPKAKYTRYFLTVENVGFAVSIGVKLCETLLICYDNRSDLSPHIHQQSVNMRTLLEAMQLIQKCHNQLENWKIKEGLVEMSDLRNLLILSLRYFSPRLHARQYLNDLILANHELLVLSQDVMNNEENPIKFDMLEHINNFANRGIMQKYGIALGHFASNSEQLNDCIFTLMHHVVGDCKKPETLYQLHILKAFTNINEHAMWNTLPNESKQLVVYIEKRFMDMAMIDPEACAQQLLVPDSDINHSLTRDSEKMEMEADDDYWSDDDVYELEQLYAMNRENQDWPAIIQSQLAEKTIDKTTQQIKTKLEQEGLLDEKNGGNNFTSENKDSKMSIPDLLIRLEKKDMTSQLEWLQTVFLEACYIKLGGRTLNEDNPHIEEPVISHHVRKKQSIPLVPYIANQEAALEDPLFCQIMLLLGICKGEDTGKIFPRIPAFWTAHDFLHKASLLGDISADCKFHPDDVLRHKAEEVTDIPIHGDKQAGSKMISSSLWCMFVQQCNIKKGNIPLDIPTNQ